MRQSLRLGLGATLLAAAQFATAGVAEIRLSNITLSVSGGEWWYWLPTQVDWLPQTAGASAALQSPALSDAATGWHGSALGASVTDSSSLAMAELTAATSVDLNGASAAAKVVANDGQMGWAFANAFDGQILVGGNATITVSATIDTIMASGTTAQANAYIELCSTDFVTDVCDFVNYAEAFVDTSGSYIGPSVLTASWTNPGDSAWAKMRIGLTASAESDTLLVPEPASWALALTALAGLGVFTRRRRPGA